MTSSTAAENGGEAIWIEGASPSAKSSRAFGNTKNGIILHGKSAKATSATATGNADIGLYVLGDFGHGHVVNRVGQRR